MAAMTDVSVVGEGSSAAPALRLMRSIEECGGLAPVAAAWDALGTTWGSPTQHSIWARAYAETYASTARLHVVTVGPPQSPRAIAPLVTRGDGHARLESLGVQDLDEPSDLLFESPAALAELACALVEQGQPLWLPRLPADSPSVGALQRAFRGRGWIYVSPAPSYPRIPFDAGWQEPERHFNAGRRSDFRRAERRAAAWGPLTYEIVSPAPAEVPPLLDAMYRVEAACWKGRAGSALGCDAARGAFFRRYAVAAAARGILRLCFLRVGGQPAAVQLAVECGQRFWLLKIGFDERFARCSPGSLLLLHTLRDAAARGLRSCEFLGTSQPWTRMWTESRQKCVAVRAYPWRAGAMATLVRDAARHAGIRLTRALGSAA